MGAYKNPVKIKSKRSFSLVPKGTIGYIVGEDSGLFVVIWEEKLRFSPKELIELPAIHPTIHPEMPLRDYFNKKELKYLKKYKDD